MAPTSYTITSNEAAIDRDEAARLIEKIDAIIWERPSVAHLVETPVPHRHVEREEVEVRVGKGFAGDHDRKSYYKGEYVPGREVSAIALEVVHAVGADPVVIGDNLITAGVDLSSLATGDLLRIGEVTLERSWKEHRPCATFRNRTSAEAFSAVGQSGARGALFVVREAGLISRGDAIVKIANS